MRSQHPVIFLPRLLVKKISLLGLVDLVVIAMVTLVSKSFGLIVLRRLYSGMMVNIRARRS